MDLINFWVEYIYADDVIAFCLYYFGGARSKAFATLRNVPNLLFCGATGHVKSVFDEVRVELVQDISRSLGFL